MKTIGETDYVEKMRFSTMANWVFFSMFKIRKLGMGMMDGFFNGLLFTMGFANFSPEIGR